MVKTYGISWQTSRVQNKNKQIVDTNTPKVVGVRYGLPEMKLNGFDLNYLPARRLTSALFGFSLT